MKTFVFVLGLLVFLSGLTISILLWQTNASSQARDKEKTGHGMVQGPPLCTWKIEVPERVIAEDQSQSIVIQATNTENGECASIFSLNAPGFDMSPPKLEQVIELPKGGRGAVSWIVTPRKSGSYDLSVSDMIDTKIIGVTVTDMFGLNAMQAKLVSIVGSIFGPMLTVPWWWDKLRKKQKQEGKQETIESGQKE